MKKEVTLDEQIKNLKTNGVLMSRISDGKESEIRKIAWNLNQKIGNGTFSVTKGETFLIVKRIK